ncbi:MAG: SDR family NAD(P)-dependent oxidoreductase [Planctomycetota bacterium]
MQVDRVRYPGCVREFASYPCLQGRAVLVTGGASGIGASLVRHFAGQGSQVAFLDVDDEAATALVAELRAESDPAPLYFPCDLRDIGALRLAVSEVEERVGDIRVLVNNAASDDRHELDEVEPDYWDERMAVNLRHQFFAAQAVRTGMAQAGGGSIINMGSIAWRLGMTQLTAYATAKAGIVGLTKALAGELGPARIRVNCIEPGLVLTERQERLWATPEFKQQVLENQSLPDLCQPADVARLALFLASDESALISAQTFVIDGGWT